MDIEKAIDDEYTMTANLGRVEIPEQMKPYIIELLALRKELQQYRQIGTVDECRATRDELIELQEYRKLGTVKECWEAREKQIAKTPDYEGDGYSDGELVYDTWICPSCGIDYEVGYDRYDYCPRCGQHIKHADWEDD